MIEKDQFFIRRCIELSAQSLEKGDAPFGALLTIDGEIIAESDNNAAEKVSDHAEVLVLHRAHDRLGHSSLKGATLYSNCEPCPMCAFMAREYKVSRVVFAIPSPYMGGYTRWNIMEDPDLENFPPFFGSIPDVKGGLLEKEAMSVFKRSGLWMFGSQAKKEFKKRNC
jgi:tRNA(adenine34) deaminase